MKTYMHQTCTSKIMIYINVHSYFIFVHVYSVISFIETLSKHILAISGSWDGIGCNFISLDRFINVFYQVNGIVKRKKGLTH